MTKATCIIIGASHAAAQLAPALRRNGWEGKIEVISAENYLPYHRPPLSKSFFSDNKTASELLIRPESAYDKAEVEFTLGNRVTDLNPQGKTLTLASGESKDYDKLVLATGGRVRKLSIEGSQLEGVHYLRTIEDAELIREKLPQVKHVTIIGAGYIGLETASMLRGQQKEVTVIETASRVLQRVTAPEVSEFYQRVHQQKGVEILLNTQISGFVGETKVSGVARADGGIIETDLVIVGVGIHPNQELAEEAGLEVGNGIEVDTHCLTSDPDIYAVGDCASFPHPLYSNKLRLESVPNATEHAMLVAAHLCGKEKSYEALPWFWSDQYDLKLLMAGISSGYDKLVIRGDAQQGEKFIAFYLKEDKVIACDSVNNPPEFMQAKRLITQQVIVNPDRLSDPATDLKQL